MRHGALATAAVAMLIASSVPGSAQYGDGYGGGGRRGGYCDQLRRACENKDSLGEVGQGNCRRFREECGGGYRDRDAGYGERGRGYGARQYGFDESEYLRCNPDVRRAVNRGQMESGAAHYRVFGRREGRRLSC
ncbi:hypothetical protein [Methylobacterium iners]|uniref:Uncharacterized protein n=1 Tax=Methylobacterium iners TaxID=418707 RepID=A0ABQ4S7T8_9HYPH|nr:hypothetical protein [Methylobacterium iners]GJD97934.1 hypothetical protein OCOJLMKI_5173 [Methylobacterium iners]